MNLRQLPGLLLMGDADAGFGEEIFGSGGGDQGHEPADRAIMGAFQIRWMY